MNTTVTQKEYPQFVTSTAGQGETTTGGGFSNFRFAPAVHNRPASITAIEREEQGICLTLTTCARTAPLSYTHETALYLYDTAEPTVDKLYLHLNLWSDTIFRVLFSNEKEPPYPFAGLPEETHMLVGKPEKVDFTLEEGEDAITLRTCAMEVRIDRISLAITAKYPDGELFFAQRKDNFQAADIFDLSLSGRDGDFACFEALDLEPDEVIYGLGERFDSVARNGKTVDFYNKDAVGTTSPRTYVNVPFFLSTKGYGLFLNSSALTDWQIGTLDVSAIQFGVWENRLEYFVIAGRTPREILSGYCSLTGFSQLPPLWSFGLWMSRNSYTSWEVAEDIGRKTRENDIPCDVLCLDTAWFDRDWNCDLKFSADRFGEPEKHMAQLKEDGFHICLWQYNFIPPNEDNDHYHEAVAHGYLSKNEKGEPYQLPPERQGSWGKDVTVDFSNPGARQWYAEKIAALIKLGAGVIKTDFGEGIALDAHYHSIDAKYFHNLYSLVYNHVVSNAIKSVSGENIVWARSGTAGSQRYPLHWGGDSQCTFDALAGTLRGALSIGISGIPFFSHDIGGFIGTPNDELYVRWAQLGLFSSHSRCHGCGDYTYREPWRFSKEACDIFRFYDKLRYSLMPYIYAEAEKCTKTGLPMMRALILEYPEDRNVRFIDDEYLFGDSLLIAPVLKPLARTTVRNVYLPKGVWFDYFTRERIESTGMWIRRNVDLKTMPIYVKEGTTLHYCDVQDTLCHGMGNIVKTEHWV